MWIAILRSDKPNKMNCSVYLRNWLFSCLFTLHIFAEIKQNVCSTCTPSKNRLCLFVFGLFAHNFKVLQENEISVVVFHGFETMTVPRDFSEQSNFGQTWHTHSSWDNNFVRFKASAAAAAADVGPGFPLWWRHEGLHIHQTEAIAMIVLLSHTWRLNIWMFTWLSSCPATSCWGESIFGTVSLEIRLYLACWVEDGGTARLLLATFVCKHDELREIPQKRRENKAEMGVCTFATSEICVLAEGTNWVAGKLRAKGFDGKIAGGWDVWATQMSGTCQEQQPKIHTKIWSLYPSLGSSTLIYFVPNAYQRISWISIPFHSWQA